MTTPASEANLPRPAHGHVAILGPEEDLFASLAELDGIVCPVDLRGSTGGGFVRGLARRFPHEVARYQKATRAGDIAPGSLFVVRRVDLPRVTDLLFFPTKPIWSEPSELDWITRGIEALIDEVHRRAIAVLGIPAIGCGQGGLAWPVVRDLLCAAARRMPATRVLIYEPRGRRRARSI
jgi:O-acetyl-ADP-ribose deacetylase (regulator of RNase III)